MMLMHFTDPYINLSNIFILSVNIILAPMQVFSLDRKLPVLQRVSVSLSLRGSCVLVTHIFVFTLWMHLPFPLPANSLVMYSLTYSSGVSID